MFNQKRLQYRRGAFALLVILLAAIGIGLILYSFNNNLVFFYSPSELTEAPKGKIIRLGGMVKAGTLTTRELRNHEFIVTDYKSEILVRYSGILPNLFKEGQGVVAKGVLEDNVFVASELLAKHDENYMPKEVYESLKNK